MFGLPKFCERFGPCLHMFPEYHNNQRLYSLGRPLDSVFGKSWYPPRNHTLNNMCSDSKELWLSTGFFLPDPANLQAVSTHDILTSRSQHVLQKETDHSLGIGHKSNINHWLKTVPDSLRIDLRCSALSDQRVQHIFWQTLCCILSSRLPHDTVFLALNLGQRSIRCGVWVQSVEDIDLWTVTEEADRPEREDLVPVPGNICERIWF